MRLDYTQLFLKEVKLIHSISIKERIEKTLLNCKEAKTPRNIKHIKKLKGYSNYFRIDIGTYRIGIQIDKDLIIFSRCLPRNDIYKYFP
jgi:mRNA interferase RelE/StbE